MRRFLWKDAETATTAAYAEELTQRLRLPARETAAIVAETESHLQDRVEDLVCGGLSPLEADQKALAGFASSRLYARQLTDGFFASKNAFRASRAGRVVLCAAFAFLFALTVFGGPFADLIIFKWGLGSVLLITVVGVIPALTIALSFCARRAQTKLIAVFGLGLTLVTFASTGYYMTRLPNWELADRRDAKWQASFWRSKHEAYVKDLKRLDSGTAAYADASDSSGLPSSLRDGSTYVVPASIRGAVANEIATGSFPLQEAFLEQTAKPGGGVLWRPSRVGSRAEAKKRWHQDAATWRTAKVKELARGDLEATYYEAASREPVVFSAQYFNENDLQPLVIALIIGALDFAGAWMGRRLFLYRRTRRDRGPLAG